MAKLFALERSVMFSALGDTGPAPGSNAAWYAQPNITPLARQFGFTHTGDELIPFGFTLMNWRAIGIDQFGAAVSVDGAVAPFGSSHQLSTSLPPNPAAVGLVFRPIWVHFAFP